MNLVLDFNAIFYGGAVNGLKVFPDNPSDTISIKWNGGTSQTFTWNNTSNYFHNLTASLPKDGYFDLIINGISKQYTYTSKDDNTSTSYGGAATIVECGSGNVWWTDDNNNPSSTWSGNTAGVQFNGNPNVMGFYYTNGISGSKGSQSSHFMGSGYSSGQVINITKHTYNSSGVEWQTGNWNFTVPTVLNCALINNAVLVDDTNTTPMNTIVTGSVTGNDTVNCTGVKTYRIKIGSQVNGVFTIDNIGNYNFTPSNNFIGLATAKYEVLCDGVLLGEANINITVTCVNVSGGIINGNSNTTINVNETYTITGLTGTAPYTYNWSGETIVSGQGTNTVVITPVTNTTIQCIITNCGGTGTVTLTKPINVKVNCTPIVYFKYSCGTASDLVITKENTLESNRLISYDSNTGNLSFTADVGTLNYLLTFTANNLSNSILFKNITC